MVVPRMTHFSAAHLQSAHALPAGRVPDDDGVVDAAGGQQSIVGGPGQVIHLQPADMLDCTHMLQGLVWGRGQGMCLQTKASTWHRYKFAYVS